MMSYRDDVLFSRHEARAIVESQREEITKAVSRVPDAKFNETDLDTLTESMWKAFTIDVPALDEASITVSPPREVSVEIGGFQYGFSGTRMVKGTSVTFRLPYSGDEILFSVRPNTFSTMLPHASVSKGIVEITFSGVELNSQEVKKQFEAQVALIKQYLGWLNNDFSGFNASLRKTVFSALSERKNHLRKNDDFVSGLGYKVQK